MSSQPQKAYISPEQVRLEAEQARLEAIARLRVEQFDEFLTRRGILSSWVPRHAATPWRFPSPRRGRTAAGGQ